jgi:hypothetical protein
VEPWAQASADVEQHYVIVFFSHALHRFDCIAGLVVSLNVGTRFYNSSNFLTSLPPSRVNATSYCCQPPPNAWYNWTSEISSFPCACAKPSSAEKAFVSFVSTSR